MSDARADLLQRLARARVFEVGVLAAEVESTFGLPRSQSVWLAVALRAIDGLQGIAQAIGDADATSALEKIAGAIGDADAISALEEVAQAIRESS